MIDQFSIANCGLMLSFAYEYTQVYSDVLLFLLSIDN